MSIAGFKQWRLNENASNDSSISRIITNVISDQGRSKDYSDLFLDSNQYTAVGILHFTKSGLKNLYDAMDTVKYFGKSNTEMIDTIKKYNGKELNDESWARGMRSFLRSRDSSIVQDRAALNKFKPYFRKYANNWSTPREYAIGVSIINSSPRNFKNFGQQHEWDAEKMMYTYCKFESDKHVKRGKPEGRCRTRCRKLGSYYPYTGDTSKYYFKGCSDLKLDNPFDDNNATPSTVKPDGSKDDNSNVTPSTVKPNSSRGARHNVVEIQQKLVDLGYYLGTYGPNRDGVDGKAGSKTRTAIKQFQSKNQLAIDGIAGPITQAKLFA